VDTLERTFDYLFDINLQNTVGRLTNYKIRIKYEQGARAPFGRESTLASFG